MYTCNRKFTNIDDQREYVPVRLVYSVVYASSKFTSSVLSSYTNLPSSFRFVDRI